MSTRQQYAYPGAPLTVIPEGGQRPLDFEVDSDGDIVITTEVPDGYRSTTEVSFFLSVEDWQAVVAHVAAGLQQSAA